MLSFLHVGTSLRCPTKIARLGASEGPMGYALRLARADAAVPGAGRAQCLAPAAGVGGSRFFLEELGGFSELLVHVLCPFVFWDVDLFNSDVFFFI